MCGALQSWPCRLVELEHGAGQDQIPGKAEGDLESGAGRSPVSGLLNIPTRDLDIVVSTSESGTYGCRPSRGHERLEDRDRRLVIAQRAAARSRPMTS